MKTQLNILLGGLGLFALQGCKVPQADHGCGLTATGLADQADFFSFSYL